MVAFELTCWELMPHPWYRLFYVVCRLCPPARNNLDISNPYSVQRFILFLNCASKILVAPPTLVMKLWLENHIFTCFFSETTSRWLFILCRRLSKSRPLYFVKTIVKLHLQHFDRTLKNGKMQ